MALPDPKKSLLWLQERGWMGEAGLSLVAGVVAAAGLQIGGMTTPVWGVPLSLVFGGSLTAGLFMLSASLRWIPDRDA